MREKLLWSAVVLMGLALAASRAQTPARTDAQAGRFQIVGVTHAGGQTPWAFRIDTVTGKTWIMVLTPTAEDVWAEMRDAPKH